MTNFHCTPSFLLETAFFISDFVLFIDPMRCGKKQQPSKTSYKIKVITKTVLTQNVFLKHNNKMSKICNKIIKCIILKFKKYLYKYLKTKHKESNKRVWKNDYKFVPHLIMGGILVKAMPMKDKFPSFKIWIQVLSKDLSLFLLLHYFLFVSLFLSVLKRTMIGMQSWLSTVFCLLLLSATLSLRLSLFFAFHSFAQIVK